MPRVTSAIAKMLRQARSEIRKKQRSVARYDGKVITVGLTRREYRRKKAGKKVFREDQHGYTGERGEGAESPTTPTNDRVQTP